MGPIQAKARPLRNPLSSHNILPKLIIQPRRGCPTTPNPAISFSFFTALQHKLLLSKYFQHIIITVLPTSDFKQRHLKRGPVNNNAPILDQFRAAGRLINEWRDSLTYCVAAPVIGALLSSCDVPATKLALGFTAVVAVREGVVRAGNWYARHKSHTANQAQTDAKPICFALSALSIGLTASAAGVAALAAKSHASSALIGSAGILVAATIPAYKAGGLRSILNAYKTMWNYTADKDGRGPGGGKKSKDWLEDAQRDMAETMFAPFQPRPRPVPIPVRNPDRAPNRNNQTLNAA